VQEGNTATFKCKVVAASPPVITWHFTKTALNPSLKYMPKYSGNEYELRIGRVKMEDKGNYVVRATNSFGTKEESAALGVEAAPPSMARRAMSMEPTSSISHTKRTFLDEFDEYQEPSDTIPKFVFHLRDRFIQEGVGFKLLASVEGKPAPRITWTKDGKTLRSGERAELTYSLGICSLEVTMCAPQDAGHYTCIAENSKGSMESTCKVTVNEKKVYRPPTYDSTYSSSSNSYTSLKPPSGGGSSSSYISSSYTSSSRNSRSTVGRTSYRRTAVSRSVSSMDRFH
jgi:hypothetical protein